MGNESGVVSLVTSGREDFVVSASESEAMDTLFQPSDVDSSATE
jgi:hypothetical protein